MLDVDVPKYLAEGWEYVGKWMALGGWESSIIRREVCGENST